MRLYRVFPYDSSALQNEPGGALFSPAGGHGRFDNPALYRAFYASLDPRGALMERFGESDVWDANTFIQPIGERARIVPLALATYDAPITLADLGLVDELRLLAVLRVTEVVSRNRSQTQSLAARAVRIHRTIHAGVCWWSYYAPELLNAMLWETGDVTLAARPDVLTPVHPLVVETARSMHRRL